MPKPSPPVAESMLTQLQGLGAQLRARRKALGVSATVAAESAGLSRVTLHRIEKGEPSVTMGAWANLVGVLGMDWGVQVRTVAEHAPTDRSAWVPVRIVLADYPQLKALAWQVQGTDALTPAEAFGIYERNARHLNHDAMPAHEQDLWQALQAAFADGKTHV